MKRFLIVDDSAFMRNVMKKILINCGHDIAGEAENGWIAFQKYKELSPDVVTMDITMTEMDGIESLRKIIQYDSSAKVIMVSAMGQKSFVEEAISIGAKGFLVKPYDEHAVKKSIARLG